MSIENPTLVHFRHFSSLLTHEYPESSLSPNVVIGDPTVPVRHMSTVHGIFTTVEDSLQIDPFLTNKANFRKSQVNVTSLITKDYENKSNWTLGENKPNSKPIQTQTNPIKANFRKAQMNVNSLITKDYRK